MCIIRNHSFMCVCVCGTISKYNIVTVPILDNNITLICNERIITDCSLLKLY